MAQGKLAEAMLCWQKAIALQSEFVDGFCQPSRDAVDFRTRT
jgi:hypothetical protein